MKEFRIHLGEHEFSFPVIQGGMAVGVSLSGLASAVARAGAVGVIAAAGIGMVEATNISLKIRAKQADPVALSQEITKAKAAAPGGVIGANIMVAMTYYDQLVRAAVESRAHAIFSGAGLPLSLPGIVSDYPDSSTALVPIVSSGRAASLICRRWKRDYNRVPDAFVVEGPLAGGHLGFKLHQIDDPEFKLERIFQDVLSVARECGEVPVFAAGGIWDGHDIARFLEAGAAGVQMGTRFVATRECDASEEFKSAYLAARSTVITKSPVGMPARAVVNPFLQRMEQGQRVPTRCPYHCIITCKPKTTPYCIAKALVDAKLGNMEEGLIFAGANVSRVTEITTVPELLGTLRRELEESMAAART